MKNKACWDLFFQTGLPEAYLLAKQRQRDESRPQNENKPLSEEFGPPKE